MPLPRNDDFILSLELAKDRASGRLTRKPPGADVAATTRQLKKLVDQFGQTVAAHHPTPKQEQLLTVDDVAARLKVCRRTVENLIVDGELAPLYIRNARRFEPKALEAYVRTRTSSTRR